MQDAFWTAGFPVLAAVFLATIVEIVEAFTIVLAVGTTRGWKPALAGTAAALGVLALVVLALGPALALIPIHLLQLVVGVLLLLFGLGWLRKAILRAAGVLALHDEDAAFAKETAALARREVSQGLMQGSEEASPEDAMAFIAGLTAFKAVLLEGLEVAFIVVAAGAGHGLLLEASLGALAVTVLVLAVGLILHRPLSRVPENALKFGVGVLLVAFGVFWTVEGLGGEWPGGELALAGLVAFHLAAALVLVRLAARRRERSRI